MISALIGTTATVPWQKGNLTAVTVYKGATHATVDPPLKFTGILRTVNHFDFFPMAFVLGLSGPKAIMWADLVTSGYSTTCDSLHDGGTESHSVSRVSSSNHLIYGGAFTRKDCFGRVHNVQTGGWRRDVEIFDKRVGE